jgi:hypothetical protein
MMVMTRVVHVGSLGTPNLQADEIVLLVGIVSRIELGKGLDTLNHLTFDHIRQGIEARREHYSPATKG